MYLYVGNSDFVGGEDGGTPQDGVSVVRLDPTSGALELVQQITGLRSPTYASLNPTKPVFYVLERFIKEDKSTPTAEQMARDCLTAFAISADDGRLTLLGRTPTGGESPMHLSLEATGTYVFTANPGRPKDPDPVKGHVTAIHLGVDGASFRQTGTANYSGQAPVWRHRPKTYPHSVFPNPSGTRLFVPQLMTDVVTIYDFNLADGSLRPAFQPYLQVSSGAGPRHVAFTPDGRYFYVVNSFDATLSVVVHDPEADIYTVAQTVDVHPQDFAGKRNISHALVSHDGRFLYCSHRTHNSIAIYQIDHTTGALTLVDRTDSTGVKPRDFSFSADGKLMAVVNQKTSDLVTFDVDTATGALTPTGNRLELYSPNCVVFGP